MTRLHRLVRWTKRELEFIPLRLLAILAPPAAAVSFIVTTLVLHSVERGLVAAWVAVILAALPSLGFGFYWQARAVEAVSAGHVEDSASGCSQPDVEK